ncbi:MAG TPA: choice-of-anchor P family protein [Terriglobales bacterium]|nr:choice-of-anchor P family protein [Terriglobales bacterium]
MKRYLYVLAVLSLLTSLASATGMSFRGQATVVNATVLGSNAKVSDTGSLGASGGARSTALVTFHNTLGVVSGSVAGASTTGFGNKTVSQASVADLELNVGGNLINAKLLASYAQALNTGGVPATSGNSVILGLTVNGKAIIVSGAPNQKIALPNGYVIINQHWHSDAASITVIALRVVVNGTADVLISRANAGVGPCTSCVPGTCSGTPNCSNPSDFVIGSASFKLSSTARANLDLSVGNNNGTKGGNLVFVDAAANVTAKVTAITRYDVVSATKRHIEALAEVNGQANVKLTLDVTDNGTPDNLDYVSLKLATGYSLSANVNAGFLQVHKACN